MLMRHVSPYKMPQKRYPDGGNAAFGALKRREAKDANARRGATGGEKPGNGGGISIDPPTSGGKGEDR